MCQKIPPKSYDAYRNSVHIKSLRIIDFIFPLLSIDHIYCTKIFKHAHDGYCNIIYNNEKPEATQT